MSSPNFVAGGPIFPRRFVSPQVPPAVAAYAGSTAYQLGQLVTATYSGTNLSYTTATSALWVCILATASSNGTFNTDVDANLIFVPFQPQQQSASAWVTSTVYSVGQFVTNNYPTANVPNLFMCIKAHTAGTFATDLNTNADWLPFNLINGGAYTVIQANGATAAPLVGISMESTDYPPLNDPRVTVSGYAAIQGEELKVYGLGECCLLDLGTITSQTNPVQFGTYLTADANGKGVVAGCSLASPSGTTNQFVGAMSLQDGRTSEQCMVQVVNFVCHGT